MNQYIREHIRTLAENNLGCKVEITNFIQHDDFKSIEIKPKCKMDITEIYSKLKASTEIRQLEIDNKINLVLKRCWNQRKLDVNY